MNFLSETIDAASTEPWIQHSVSGDYDFSLFTLHQPEKEKSENESLSFSYSKFWALVFIHLPAGCLQSNSGEELGIQKIP